MTKRKIIHIKDRTVDDLLVGGYYFISFDAIKTERVELLALDKERNLGSVKIIAGKNIGKTHALYLDEIRLTEESAKQNCVSS